MDCSPPCLPPLSGWAVFLHFSPPEARLCPCGCTLQTTTPPAAAACSWVAPLCPGTLPLARRPHHGWVSPPQLPPEWLRWRIFLRILLQPAPFLCVLREGLRLILHQQCALFTRAGQVGSGAGSLPSFEEVLTLWVESLPERSLQGPRRT